MSAFAFSPHSGALPGLSFEAQTEAFLNQLAEEAHAASIVAAEAQSSVAQAVSAAEAAQLASVVAEQAARQAQSFAENAIAKAETALQQAQAATTTARNAMTVAEDSLKTALATQNAVHDLDFQVGQVQQDLAQKAPLFSPEFGGVPTAPTAAAGDDSAHIANTAFVQGEIASQSAPVSHVGETGSAHGVVSSTTHGFMSSEDKVKLDSIASGAQPNAVISVAGKAGAVTLTIEDISGGAPLASPAFTGTPTVPTPAANAHDAQAANTAFVQSAIAPLSTRLAALESFVSGISIFKA